MIEAKCFSELERVESVLKSEEELDVEISEAYPLTVLYGMVSLY